MITGGVDSGENQSKQNTTGLQERQVVRVGGLRKMVRGSLPSHQRTSPCLHGLVRYRRYHAPGTLTRWLRRRATCFPLLAGCLCHWRAVCSCVIVCGGDAVMHTRHSNDAATRVPLDYCLKNIASSSGYGTCGKTSLYYYILYIIILY